QFSAADTRRVERFQDRAVPQAHRRLDVRHHQHALGVLNREGGARDALFHGRRIRIRGGGVQGVIVSRQPAEPRADRRQPRVLRAERERLSVLLPVVVEIALIALQDRARDFHGVFDAALLGPTDEVSDGPACVIGGVLRVVVHQQPFEMFFQQAAERRVRLGLSLVLDDAGHHFAPAAAPFAFPATGTTTTGFCFTAGTVIFSGFWLKPPFRRTNTGDSSPRPPPDIPPTWGRLDPGHWPFCPDFFVS